MVSIGKGHCNLKFSLLKPERPYARQEFQHEQTGKDQTHNAYCFLCDMTSRLRNLSFAAEELDDKLEKDTCTIERYQEQNGIMTEL
ncbi:hypothetical protein KCU87_g73, partial [Aureobasidium melanogenum]